MAKRKLENWLLGFKEWASPRTEAPEAFIFWTGLFTLAAAIRKHVWIPQGILGNWECYPNVYIIFVGPPGIAKKTTSMTFGDKLLAQLPEVPASPTIVTQAALATAIATSSDGSMYITASELASLISKSKTDMYEFLTDGYDTRKDIRISTISRGPETIKNPCFNMLACTQPAWILENMPASVIGGGFAARCIFVFEDSPSSFKMYYTHIDWNIINDLEQKLVEDLVYISQNINGEFSLTKEALDFGEDWYVSNMNKVKEKDPRLQGYFSRKAVHLHKVAELLVIAQRDELVITEDDLKAALRVLETIEYKLMHVFRNVGRNIHSVDVDTIREFIRMHKKVERSLVYKSFQAIALPDVVDKLLTGLALMGDITVSLEDGITYFISK